MTSRVDDLIAELMSLPFEERQRVAEILINSASGVRNGDARLYEAQSAEKDGMKLVTVELPDELATRAQAAGLLGSKRIEELIRRALQDPGHVSTGEGRKLVRRNERLVVEALPGEQRTTDVDVRDALDRMDW